MVSVSFSDRLEIMTACPNPVAIQIIAWFAGLAVALVAAWWATR